MIATTVLPSSEDRVTAFAKRHLPPHPAPVARTDLALALAMGRLTPALAALYGVHDGLMLHAYDVFDLQEAAAHPAQSVVQRAFPGAVLFGWDRSGYVFFVDAQNVLYRGAGAIFAVDKVYVEPSTCVLCAPDLATFLESTETGRPPWYGTRLIDQQITALRDAISAHPSHVDTRPGSTATDITDAAKAASVSPGRGHIALLEVTDGLLLPQAGVTVFGKDELGPVKGDIPGYCRFGTGPGSLVLTITNADAARPTDLILKSFGNDPGSAAAVGPVLDVVTGWIIAGDIHLPDTPDAQNGNAS
ncbi:hypothetical protein QTO30_01600 [Yoonia sp. GPGPB17]|uniref:hypothetical protein n=1 Tax=Yoonia sp. GPGPB17 TaxID=3026147 RepID=UPI0030C19DF5